MSAPPHAAPDEEAPTPAAGATFPPLGEISFRRSRLFSPPPPADADDDTVPSETSTLLAPSTLTNPDRNASAEAPSGGVIRSRRAFELAALLGFLAVGGLFGADVAYARSKPSRRPADYSDRNMSASKAEEALDLEPRIPHREEKTKKHAKTAKHHKKRKHEDEEEEEEEGDEEEEDEEEEEEQNVDHAPAAKVPAPKVPAPKIPATNSITKKGEGEASGANDEHIVTTSNRQTVKTILMPDIIEDWYEEDDDDDDEGNVVKGAVPSVPATADDDYIVHGIAIPRPYERCPHVIDTFEAQNADVTNEEFLRNKYLHQSTDPNVFYRATALLFWTDFAGEEWGLPHGRPVRFQDLVAIEDARYAGGTPLSPLSTWTWVTGDQHLSNFGAWRNRAGEVVFSVNDFDEAAIFDFQIDVLRIAVSICAHGFTNGFQESDVREAVEAFTYTYVKTAVDYVGGDAALTYELTPHTSTGALRDFLWDTETKRGHDRQMDKFTELDEDGVRRFSRNDKTRLEDVPPEVEAMIRAEMTGERYGASMMKMGWRIQGWDDDFYTVLDVARRVGSGVGSYGVDRFYVLLKGTDTLLEEDEDGGSVILDVKYEPTSAITRVLEAYDYEQTRQHRAWYRDMFQHEADRVAQAQIRLTSFTDPYVGYLVIGDDSYSVRQRSPYKSSFDYDTLTDRRVFNEFMEQIAIATATAHVRGTVSKSPGQFKHVIKLLLAGERNRRRWSDLIENIALSYREQVLLDFECFKDYVETRFPADN